MYNNTSGANNTAAGIFALGANTTGDENTAVGYSALGTNTTGHCNTAIGHGADVSTVNLVNATAIGCGAQVSCSNTMSLGNNNVTKWGFGVACPAAGNILEFANTTATLTTGGVWTNASDRTLKENIEPLDKAAILAKIAALEITRWNYIADENKEKYIGPMAQDFHALFGVGREKTISTIDPAGVALVGIQALLAENQLLKQENEVLKSRLDKVENSLVAIENARQQIQHLTSLLQDVQNEMASMRAIAEKQTRSESETGYSER